MKLSIGHGNRSEMLQFKKEVQQQIKDLNLNLEIEIVNILQEKYGEMQPSKFFELFAIGSEEELQILVNNN